MCVYKSEPANRLVPVSEVILGVVTSTTVVPIPEGDVRLGPAYHVRCAECGATCEDHDLTDLMKYAAHRGWCYDCERRRILCPDCVRSLVEEGTE